MRKDMKKVLTERPRFGHSKKYHEIRSKEFRGDEESMPFHQSMRLPHIKGWNSKEFSDLIGPLKRFLWTCLGRPWNDVWSEICQNVPSNNTVDSHLKEHVLREIDIHCFVNDNEIYLKPSGGYRSYQLKPRGLYVDPRDGIIKDNSKNKPSYKNVYYYDPLPYNKTPRYYYHTRYIKGDNDILIPVGLENYITKNPDECIIKLFDNGKAVFIDGVWYMFTYKECKPPRLVTLIDSTGKTYTKKIYFNELDQLYGYTVSEGKYHSDKRQINSKDLRKFGLINFR